MSIVEIKSREKNREMPRKRRRCSRGRFEGLETKELDNKVKRKDLLVSETNNISLKDILELFGAQFLLQNIQIL